MKIKCKRDVCVRSQCPAPKCDAAECANVCKHYIRIAEKYDQDVAKLQRKRDKVKEDLKKKYPTLGKEEIEKLPEYRKAQIEFQEAKRPLTEQFSKDSSPFRSCENIFEIPDETPEGAVVICPVCNGENIVTYPKKQQISIENHFFENGELF